MAGAGCRGCASAVPRRARFCPICGEFVRTSRLPPRDRRRLRWAVALGLVAIGVASLHAAGGSLPSGRGSSPRSVVPSEAVMLPEPSRVPAAPDRVWCEPAGCERWRLAVPAGRTVADHGRVVHVATDVVWTIDAEFGHVLSVRAVRDPAGRCARDGARLELLDDVLLVIGRAGDPIPGVPVAALQEVAALDITSGTWLWHAYGVHYPRGPAVVQVHQDRLDLLDPATGELRLTLPHGALAGATATLLAVRHEGHLDVLGEDEHEPLVEVSVSRGGVGRLEGSALIVSDPTVPAIDLVDPASGVVRTRLDGRYLGQVRVVGGRVLVRQDGPRLFLELFDPDWRAHRTIGIPAPVEVEPDVVSARMVLDAMGRLWVLLDGPAHGNARTLIVDPRSGALLHDSGRDGPAPWRLVPSSWLGLRLRSFPGGAVLSGPDGSVRFHGGGVRLVSEHDPLLVSTEDELIAVDASLVTGDPA